MKDVNLLINNGVNVEKALELFGDMQTFDDTLIEFLKVEPEKLSKIRLYKESSNMPDYAIEVHSLKSDAKYFGFDKLAELAYQHELESKANNKQFVYDNFDSLMVEANRIIELAREYMGENKNSNQSTTTNEEIDDIEIPENTVLVADDSPIVANFVKKVFEGKYNIMVAEDGKQTIDIVKSINNDNILCLLLDLNMPKVNGFEVLEYFKNNAMFSKIPVSIITGDSSKEAIEKAFTYNIVDMLNKPFNESNVKTIVERTISRK